MSKEDCEVMTNTNKSKQEGSSILPRSKKVHLFYLDALRLLHVQVNRADIKYMLSCEEGSDRSITAC